MTPAPIKTGRDGGMHPMFLAKLKPQEVREPDGTVRYMVDENAAKQARLLRQSAVRDLSDRTRGDRHCGAMRRSARSRNRSPARGTYMMAAAEFEARAAGARVG